MPERTSRPGENSRYGRHLHADPVRVAGLSFVVGGLATTLFLVVVFDATVRAAALESFGYAAGAAIGIYLAYSNLGSP